MNSAELVVFNAMAENLLEEIKTYAMDHPIYGCALAGRKFETKTY